MEEVENMWRKLSLSVEEEVGLEVPKLLGVTKSLLAGKFLTHYMVNKEAVFRTFKPLWRTRKPFLIHDMSENKMVFEFKKEVDLDRVMEFEPWTYDKHLIHNLPIKSMTPELGRSIGGSIGKVARVADYEEKGTIGHSLRVRVSIDVSKSLSKGRKLCDNGVAVGWFGPWLRAKTDYPFHKPWSSGVGSEREEASQSRQTMSLSVQVAPSGRLSGMGDDVPRATTTQPDNVTWVGESESGLHAKPLLEDSKRFDETLQWIDREFGLPADSVAPPFVAPLEIKNLRELLKCVGPARSLVFDDVVGDLHEPCQPALLVPNHARLDSRLVVNVPPLFLCHPIPNPNVGHNTLLGAPTSSPTAVVIEGGWLLARLTCRR
nr:hypothetical protein CFP56_33804 [Quercus suber]